MNVKYGKVTRPPVTVARVPVDLTDRTMEERRKKVLEEMRRRNLDILAVYGDREHGANYGYLTGFEPRFEESLLVLHKEGHAFLLLGNESVKMAQYSRIKAVGIHTPYFSLPNQPMKTRYTFKKILEQAGFQPGKRTGIVGWKLFTGKEKNMQMFDVPAFIVNGICECCGALVVSNATDLFIHPQYGVRIKVNANEIAHYEYGASLASYCIYKVMEEIKVGKSEMELGELLSAQGQPLSVQSICATGERFTNAVIAPRDKKIRIGDRVTFTMGLHGGLTHRCGYAVFERMQMKTEEKDYLEAVAIPYYQALAVWYSQIGIGVPAVKIFQEMECLLPQESFHRTLNPGHYISDEEWMSSPFYPESPVILESGMMLQADMIISVGGFGGANAEDGIVIADKALQNQLKDEYPEVWDRFQQRRIHMREILHIPVREEILPMSMICGYFRPYLLEKEKAFYIE